MAVGSPNVLYDSGASNLTSGSLTSSSFTPAGGSNDAIFVAMFTSAHPNITTGGSATFSTDGAATDIADHVTQFLGRGIATWVLTGPTATSQTVTVSPGSGFSEDVRVLVFEMSGVDQTTPNDTAVEDDADSVATLTQDISSATDDRVVSFVINQTNDPTPEGTAIGTDVEYETGWYAGAQHVAGASPTASCDWSNLSGLSAGIWFNVNAAAGGGGGGLSIPVAMHYYRHTLGV